MKNNYVMPGGPCVTGVHQRTIEKRFAVIKNSLRGKNGFILDVGTGHGIYERKLCHFTEFCIATDININYLKELKRDNLENLELIRLSAESLPFKDDSIPIIIMIEVIEHINDDETAVKELSRVMKSNGQLIFTAPNKLFPFEEYALKLGKFNLNANGLYGPFLPYLPEFIRQHIATARVYTISRLHRILEENRFSIIHETYLGPSFDQGFVFFPKTKKIVNAIYQIIDNLENSFIKYFLTTIMIVCKKK
jgi:ubiquinone/menaquinone biosynthesis C-methylase UbiE